MVFRVLETASGAGAYADLANNPLLRGTLPPFGKYDSLRMVEIEGLDINACGGTHLKNIGELKVIKLLRTEKDRGDVRLHFIAGNRYVLFYVYVRNMIPSINYRSSFFCIVF